MKSIGTMTEDQMTQMANVVQEAAIKFAKDNDFGGLSNSGAYNFYTALQDAIRIEWYKAILSLADKES